MKVRFLTLSLSILVFGLLNNTWALPNLNSPANPVGPLGRSRLLGTLPVEKTSTSKKENSLGFNCADLRRTALKIAAHGSNLANLKTTRTPAGGPYKRLEVVCKIAGGAFCNIEAFDDVRIETALNHPDADEKAQVKLPNIDPLSESAGLNTAVSELRIMAQNGVCGVKVIENGSALIVRYHPDFEVDMDTLGFAADGTVSRWSRTSREGRTQSMSFQTTVPSVPTTVPSGNSPNTTRL